jgi:hypothetical protein
MPASLPPEDEIARLRVEKEELKADLDEALKALRPMLDFGCSFDGFSFEDAEFQFRGRTIGTMSAKVHAEVARVLDPVFGVVRRLNARDAQRKAAELAAEYGPSNEMIQATRALEISRAR